jgi:hypothetical protein
MSRETCFSHAAPRGACLVRVLSSYEVIESADRVVRTVIQTYLAPNKTFREVTELLDNHAKNPLRDFGNACRRELRGPDPP